MAKRGGGNQRGVERERDGIIRRCYYGALRVPLTVVRCYPQQKHNTERRGGGRYEEEFPKKGLSHLVERRKKKKKKESRHSPSCALAPSSRA